MAYWLMKSEPDVFGLDDLEARPGKTEHWDGVRNYQARNYLRAMCKGDLAFFYHSNCAEPGVAGIVEIVRGAYPDFTAWDPKSEYYDPKSAPDRPRWYMVDVRFRRRLPRPVTLAEIKAHPALADMPLMQRGSRLSVMPVTARQWNTILKLSERQPPRRANSLRKPRGTRGS
jgi:predicted RNA-binding protein with PUA-like domain